MVRTPRPRPIDLVVPWPDGSASEAAGTAAATFVRALNSAIDGRSIRSVAAACGVNHQTIRGVLAGEVWPDMYTVARLEEGLNARLWRSPTEAP